MQKLSLKKQLTIVRLYLAGLSYDEIAARCGVSKGTVANVIADLKAGRIWMCRRRLSNWSCCESWLSTCADGG